MTTPDLDSGGPATTHDRDGGNEISHAVCAVCYPDAPQIGQTAACGSVIKILDAVGPRCVVCLDLIPKHTLEHVYRGEAL
jgi:hypothetical protein